MKIPLGGSSKNYFSKESRGTVINMYPEVNEAGDFSRVRRVEGFKEFVSAGSNVTRSNLFENSGFVYWVNGTDLFRVDAVGNIQNLGVVGGSGKAQIVSLGQPGDNQLVILNGDGLGFTYTNAGGLVQITDPDFHPSVSVTVLGERAWFVRKDTGQFFCSAVSDAQSYDPLAIATAEEHPDDLIAITSKKSNLYLFGERTTEYHQTIADDTFPVRRVTGATKHRGIVALNSLAEYGDKVIFFADDLTVRFMESGQMFTISDLDFQIKVKGNGTLENPGFNVVDDAEGFFIDSSEHKVYVLTFPDAGWTWCYDFSTGVSHLRETETENRWRINSAALAFEKIIVGDAFNNKLYELTFNEKSEDGAIQRTTLRTPSVSFEKNATIPLIEANMEVGVGTLDGQGANPKMMVRYSKDGGFNYENHSTVDLGGFGDYKKRVAMRQFGRVVRNKDFILQMEVTDPVDVVFYGLDADVQVSGF